MDVSSLTSLPSYGLDVTVDMLTTSSDVKLNADNVHISFALAGRWGKGQIRGQIRRLSSLVSIQYDD